MFFSKAFCYVEHHMTKPLPALVQALSSQGSYGSDSFQWTASTIVLSIFLFLAAGLAEIGGGWLVWQAVRVQGTVGDKPWWQDQRAVMTAILGSLTLVGYGFIPTAQPPPTFGRLYAVYGGFFIALSFAWGWVIDKDRPDKGAQLDWSFMLCCYCHLLPSLTYSTCRRLHWRCAGHWRSGTSLVLSALSLHVGESVPIRA